MLDSYKLPFRFDPVRLTYDLAQIPSDAWIDHFNDADYEGAWSAVALYSPNGQPDFIHAMQTPEFEMHETELLQSCNYLHEVVETFLCRKRAIRLLRLHPSSKIREHCGPDLNIHNDVAHLHIPIVTNPGIKFLVNGHRINMARGECWYADFSLPHSVVNDTQRDRTYLAIDCEVNSWLREMLSLDATESERLSADSRSNRH